jgi:DNA-binding NarL/FixJ family response regulator
VTPQLLRILLVEDNPADSRLISEYLKEAKNCRFELVYADRLSAGLKILAQGKVDLVLLDLNLPDSTGFDTFTKMQTAMPQIAVVVLTGLADEKMAVQAVRDGAQDYLIKSTLDGSLLSRAIRYAIERHRLGESVQARTRELQEMENRFRTLFNAAADGIFFNDLDGRLLEVNEEPAASWATAGRNCSASTSTTWSPRKMPPGGLNSWNNSGPRTTSCSRRRSSAGRGAASPWSAAAA